MKIGFFATAAALALGGGAAGAKADSLSGFSWSGAYVGGQIGYAGGREHDNLSNAFVDGPTDGGEGGGGGDGGGDGGGEETLTADDFSMNGFVGGVYAGVAMQTSGNFVFGIEGDFQGGSYDGSHDYQGFLFDDDGGEGGGDGEGDGAGGGEEAGLAVAAPPGFEEGTLKMRTAWQGSIRARAGYAFGRTLVYGTGGLAFARAELADDGVFEGTQSYDVTDTKTLTGYTIGIGIEHAFTDHLVGRLEGRYSDFGSKTFDLDAYDVEADFNKTQVAVGISYKF